MTKQQTIKWLRAKKCNLFATQPQCNINLIPEQFSGSEKSVSAITMGMTFNTVLEGLARELENTEADEIDQEDLMAAANKYDELTK